MMDFFASFLQKQKISATERFCLKKFFSCSGRERYFGCFFKWAMRLLILIVCLQLPKISVQAETVSFGPADGEVPEAVCMEENTTVYIEEPIALYAQDASQQALTDPLWAETFLWGYSDLALRSNGAARQQLYQLILQKNESFSESTADTSTVGNYHVFSVLPLSEYGLTVAEATETYFMFREDHPQYYWMSGKMVYSSENGFVKNMYLCTYDEFASGQTRAEVNAELHGKLSEYLAAAAGAGTRYEMVRTVYEKLLSEVSYGYGENNGWVHSIAGSFLACGHGTAVCEGYAKALQLVLNVLGIPCIFVAGNLTGSVGHAWNLVQMEDGLWYGLDATWDDAGSDPNRPYFLAGGALFAASHRPLTPDGTKGTFQYALPSVAAASYIRPEEGTESSASESTPDSSAESSVAESTQEGSSESSAAESTPEGSAESSAAESASGSSAESSASESTPEGSAESSASESTPEGSAESSASESTPEGSAESSASESTPEGSAESSASESTPEGSAESSASESTPEGSAESSVTESTPDSSGESSAAESTPEGSAESSSGSSEESSAAESVSRESTDSSSSESTTENGMENTVPQSVSENSTSESVSENSAPEKIPESKESSSAEGGAGNSSEDRPESIPQGSTILESSAGESSAAQETVLSGEILQEETQQAIADSRLREVVLGIEDDSRRIGTVLLAAGSVMMAVFLLTIIFVRQREK